MPRLNDIARLDDDRDAVWMPTKFLITENFPLDLCTDCWNLYLFDASDETDHPIYDDGEYNCIECGAKLTEPNDGGLFLRW